MGERRALIEGLTEEDRERENEFVYNKKPRQAARTAAPAAKAAPPKAEEAPEPPPLPQSVVAAAQVPATSPLTGVGRVPVGARVRTELAAALKRASLERQLQGIQPNSVQEIIEDSLELWLLKHGHLG
jgi:hypothetical protein